MTILLFLLISYILLSISLMKLFEKAGEPSWHGLVPGLNFISWNKIIGRSKWYPLLLLLPIVNIFIFCSMAIELVRSFHRMGFWDSALAVIYAPLEFFRIGRSDAKYVEKNYPAEKAYQSALRAAQKSGDKYQIENLTKKSPYARSGGRQWIESLVFAIFAAAFIRMFLIEAYTIPTPSMEDSMLVGDYLFVSKAHYGIRTPETPLMLPLLHNRIPIIGGESYIEKPNLPVTRLPALESIDRYDPVVFNWPVGDSIYLTSRRSWSARQAADPNTQAYDPQLRNEIRKGNLITRPIDKRDHYIKRAVGLPGENLEIRDRVVYINGEAVENPEKVQFQTLVNFSGNFNFKLLEDMGVDLQQDISQRGNTYFAGKFSQSEIDALNDLEGVEARIVQDYIIHQIDSTVRNILKENGGLREGQLGRRTDGKISLRATDTQASALRGRGYSLVSAHGPRDLFPNDGKISGNWTVDNYGPVHIPKKGETTALSSDNVAFYIRAIDVYEDHDIELKNKKIYIDGEEADSYTWTQDYYWMMGDNRHASEDSRMWGFVPHDHIVGKPLFIFFSAPRGNPANGVRWNRIFKKAS